MGRFVKNQASARLCLFLIIGALVARAGETDNFSLPLDTDLADLGPYLETVHTIALERAVAEVNASIEKAILIQDEPARTARLQQLHDPLALSKTFVDQFAHPLIEEGQLESAVSGSWGRRSFPGQRTSEPGIWMNFAAHFPLDLRRWMMLSQSHTIRAFGVYFGTDKIIHFHHLGAAYYEDYRGLRAAGYNNEDAYADVIENYARKCFWSEAGGFGTVTTGIYSNADMAANHAGFLFYLNFTEGVVLKGRRREPLLQRGGVFWRLNRHVRPRSGWLEPFISDHWNEALNPNRYDSLMGPGIRSILRHRAPEIVKFYTEKDGRPADPAYFNNLAKELSTYYGEPYGHCGSVETLMTIGNTCMPAVRPAGTK